MRLEWFDRDVSRSVEFRAETIRPKDVFEVLQLANKAYEMLSEAVVEGRAFVARESPEAIRRFRKDLRPTAELVRQFVDD